VALQITFLCDATVQHIFAFDWKSQLLLYAPNPKKKVGNPMFEKKERRRRDI
jgi:hypothetical protein